MKESRRVRLVRTAVAGSLLLGSCGKVGYLPDNKSTYGMWFQTNEDNFILNLGADIETRINTRGRDEFPLNRYRLSFGVSLNNNGTFHLYGGPGWWRHDPELPETYQVDLFDLKIRSPK